MTSTASVTLAKERLVGDSILSQTLWILAFATATALSARFEIPHEPVPFTLQTLFVILSGALLGPRNGAISQIAYLSAGLLGLPVFAGGSFGLARLVGPTGGYLMAFPLAAAVVGLLLGSRRNLVWSFTAMTCGLLVIFAVGTIHLYAFYIHSIAAAFNGGFLIFTWWDLLKLGAASMTYHEIAKRWRRVPEEAS
jgi:biotin transport system substrate-specific component